MPSTRAAEAIRAAVPGASLLPLVGDVTRETEAARIVEETAARLGGLHTLVNVAGVRVYAPLAEADAADWERIIGVNVLGTAHCCKAALPRMRGTGRGTIVNVSSVYGLMGRTGMGQYDTTKAAVLGFTRALAVEEAPHRVRVNAVCPGGTITPYHIRRAAARGVSETELRGGADPGQPAGPLGRAARGGVSHPVPGLRRVLVRDRRHPHGGRGPIDPVTAPPGGPPRVVSPRVISVDVLRGLTVAAMVLVNNPGSWASVYWPLRHAEWNGFTPTDMIFPFFLFIVGVSIPLALGPRLEERRAARLVGRVLWRSLAIFALGLLLHALPWFHLATLRIPGVLQRIAVCYLLAALLVIVSGGVAGWRLQAVVAGALLVGYWLLMTRVAPPGGVAGDLSPAGNLAGYVDRVVLGPHIWQAAKFYDPEGVLSTLPAVATTLLGVLAGHWIRGAGPTGRTVGGLAIGGVAATAAGWLWALSFPINKSLWTSSYALFMSGLAALALAICYWMIEVRGWRRLTGPFVVLGVTALPLFFLSSLMARLLLLIRVGPDRIRLHAWLFEHLFAPWASAVQRVPGLRRGLRAALVGPHVGAPPERAPPPRLTPARDRLTKGLSRSQKRHGRSTQASA